MNTSFVNKLRTSLKPGNHVFAIIEGTKRFGTVAEVNQGSIIMTCNGMSIFADLDTVTAI